MPSLNPKNEFNGGDFRLLMEGGVTFGQEASPGNFSCCFQ